MLDLDFHTTVVALFVNRYNAMVFFGREASDNVVTQSYEIGFVLQASYPARTLFALQTQYIVLALDCNEEVIHEILYSYSFFQ